MVNYTPFVKCGEAREKLNIPDNDSFMRWVPLPLPLLLGSIDKPKRQLDTLRSTRVGESVVDRSFLEMDTSRVQPDRWVSTRIGRKVVYEPVTIPLSSR